MAQRHTMLLEGPPGTGKTTSLRTAAAAIKPKGGRLFLLSTEPGVDIVIPKPVPRVPEMGDNFHWAYLPPARPRFEDLRMAAQKINTMTIESLQKQAMGINKAMYNQFLQMIDLLANFKCTCHGETFGPVDELPEADCFVIDGLTGISTMSMDLTTGAKPAKTQPDWGVAMDNLERFVAKCVFDTKCSFVLISHVGREKDEVTGGVQITTHTLGVKLAPKLVQMFDEVVLAKRTNNGFVWSNDEPNCDLKNRFLPLSSNLMPDFAQLFVETPYA